MKKVLKFTVMAALLFSTVTAMANEPKMSLVADNAAKSLIFRLDVKTKDTKIQFLDSENNVIYYDNSVSKGFSKKFDLSNARITNLDVVTLNSLSQTEQTLEITDKLIVEKAINFKKAFKGDYTISVKDANGVYLENISI